MTPKVRLATRVDVPLWGDKVRGFSKAPTSKNERYTLLLECFGAVVFSDMPFEGL